jgi:hypothetical protein
VGVHRRIPAVLFGPVIVASAGSFALRDIVIAALVSLFGDAITWVLFLRPRLVISDDAVMVVNYGRPRFFPCEEVIGFDVRLRLQVRTRGRGTGPTGGRYPAPVRASDFHGSIGAANEDHRGHLGLTGQALPTLTI